MALPPPSPDSTCVVTGASSGIGAAVASALAKRGYGVTLVARREERLLELADGLGPDADVHACDVTDPDARKGLADALAAGGKTVAILVNNAGFSTSGPFVKTDRERELDMVRTNIEAVVDFCALFARRWPRAGVAASSISPRPRRSSRCRCRPATRRPRRSS